MVKMYELPAEQRIKLVEEINRIMRVKFLLEQESVDEFWQTVEIGLEARRAI